MLLPSVATPARPSGGGHTPSHHDKRPDHSGRHCHEIQPQQPVRRIPRSRNKRKITTKLQKLLRRYERHNIDYPVIIDTLQGWNAYAMQANTYRLRQRLTEWTTNELVRIAALHVKESSH